MWRSNASAVTAVHAARVATTVAVTTTVVHAARVVMVRAAKAIAVHAVRAATRLLLHSKRLSQLKNKKRMTLPPAEKRRCAKR